MIASPLIWSWSTGSISIETVNRPKVEMFYWVTIMFSQTLGTALGDWVADTNDIGYLGGAAAFGGLLLITALLYYFTRLWRAVLFWAAFILTRPLGAVVGDFLGGSEIRCRQIDPVTDQLSRHSVPSVQLLDHKTGKITG